MLKQITLLLVALSVLTACQYSTDKEATQSSRTEKKTAKSVSKSSTATDKSRANSNTSNSGASSESSSSQANTPSPSSSEQTSPPSSSQEAPIPAPAPASPSGPYHSVQGRDGEVIIVNKKHGLDPSYAPGEHPVARDAFFRLLGDMRAAGYAVSNDYSGFRSYDYQASLYQSYVARDGQVQADTYSARPGHSEHQTGLAFDVKDTSGALLTEPNAAAWLAQNAHQYGFILRYPQGKESITGYTYESWHIRYIGSEAAAIYQSGLTLEEYYGVPGGDYAQ